MRGDLLRLDILGQVHRPDNDASVVLGLDRLGVVLAGGFLIEVDVVGGEDGDGLGVSRT